MPYVYNLSLFIRTADGLVNRPLYVRDGVGSDPNRFSLQDSLARLRLTGWWSSGHNLSFTATGSVFSEVRRPERREQVIFFLNDFLLQVEGVRPPPEGTGLFVNAPPAYRNSPHTFSWRVVARRAGERLPPML
jgi:hypothetical protein